MEKSLYDQKPISNIPLFRYLGPEYFTELKNRESRGHGNMAISKSNAMGPFQIKEVALQELKNRYKELGHVSKEALFDPGTSLKLASLYLDHIGDGMQSVIGQNRKPDPGLILAGYRLGPSYVNKVLKSLPEDQRTWMGFRRHLSQTDQMPDDQKTSVLKYLDTILMSAGDPQSRDNKNYTTELKRAQSHPFFFYQTGNYVPDLGGGRSKHADGPIDPEIASKADLLGRLKNLTGGIGSVMGTAGIANGDPTLGGVGSALSGFATAGLPGAIVQGGMGLISAYQNKANEELALLESEEALRRSKSVGMDKGFNGYNQTLYQKGGPIKRKLQVIGNPDALNYDDGKLWDVYRDLEENNEAFKNISNTQNVLWDQLRNGDMSRVLKPDILSQQRYLRNKITDAVFPKSYYDNIGDLENIKSDLAHIKYAQLYGEPKSVFESEFERLKPGLKKNYKDVKYTAVHQNPQELEKILSTLSKDDQVMIMDHVGDRMLGIPMTELSQIFKKYYPKGNKNPCLWGACDGSTILPEFSRESGLDAIGTNDDQWQGGNPNAGNILDVLFPNKKDRKLYKSDGSMISNPKMQLGTTRDTIRPNNLNQFLFDKYTSGGVKPKYIVHEYNKSQAGELPLWQQVLKTADDVLSAPARAMVKGVTGKYQDPSEAWGYKDPKGFWENAANVGINILADPTNLLGVGVAKNVVSKVVPKLVKVGKAAEIVNDANKSDYIIKASKNLFNEYLKKGDNLNDLYKGKLDDKFKDFVTVAYKEIPEYKIIIEKSLKVNKPGAAIAVINDAIDIKNGSNDIDRYIPHYDFNTKSSSEKFKLTSKLVKKNNSNTAKKNIGSKRLVPTSLNETNTNINDPRTIDQDTINNLKTLPFKRVIPDTTYWHVSPYIGKNSESHQMTKEEFERSLEKKQLGSNINTTGYTPGTETYNNEYNIIPSNNLTMKDTPFNVLGIPNKGRAKIMKAGLRKIVFPNADYVTEIPLRQSGGNISAININTDLGPMPNFKRRVTSSNINDKNLAKLMALPQDTLYEILKDRFKNSINSNINRMDSYAGTMSSVEPDYSYINPSSPKEVVSETSYLPTNEGLVTMANTPGINKDLMNYMQSLPKVVAQIPPKILASVLKEEKPNTLKFTGKSLRTYLGTPKPVKRDTSYQYISKGIRNLLTKSEFEQLLNYSNRR